MSLDAARRVADAVLYEGYLLYPYRASAAKNRSRWQFGVLGPPAATSAAFAEPAGMSMDCLLSAAGPGGAVTVHLRFLQLQVREVRDRSGRPVDRLTVAGEPVLSWAEAVEHEITLRPVPLPAPSELPAGFPPAAPAGSAGSAPTGADGVPPACPAGSADFKVAAGAGSGGLAVPVGGGSGGLAVSDGAGFGGLAVSDGAGSGGLAVSDGAGFGGDLAVSAGAGSGGLAVSAGAGFADFAVSVPGGVDEELLGDAGRLVRRRWPLAARVRTAVEADGDLTRLTVRVTNEHPDPVTAKDEAVRYSLLGTHLLIEARDARFVSVQDPPPEAASAARRCRSDRCWPVLAGSDAVLLGAPIILYDHPEVAGESPGELFDSTEIDEILTLRVMTMTEAEKAEARATDPRARTIVDRCDAMSPAGLQRLHGTRRPVPGHANPPPPATSPAVASGAEATAVAFGNASGSGLPEVASGRAVPGVASRGAFPGVMATGAVPEVASRGAFPGVASRGAFPGIAARGAVPEVVATGAVPEVAASGAFPEKASEDGVPEVAAGGTAPEAASRSASAKVAREGALPAVSSAAAPAGDGELPWWDPAAEAAVDPAAASVLVGGVPIARGSLVRLHPSRRADAQDLFFADQVARVTAVVSDVDGGTHVAVVLVDDPAADLHDWYGRYFYFAPDELEPLDTRGTPC